jgi:uncharacterized membrane protein
MSIATFYRPGCSTPLLLRTDADVRACAQFTGIVVGLLIGLGVTGAGVYMLKNTSALADVVASIVLVTLFVAAFRALSITYAQNQKIALKQQQAAVLGMAAPNHAATTTVAQINWMSALSGFLHGGTSGAMR